MGCIIKFKGQSIPEEQFLQYLNKQIAINNLFEEDKTLANSVYEALGFKTNADVILPIGTSGSGKSTFIKSLPQENLVVIEPDAMRVEFTGDMNDKSKDKEVYEEATKRAITAIKQGKQVVFDTTNLTKEKRRPFIEDIREEIPNANIQYKLMELNPELAKQRIKAQLERGENRAAVSDETIDRHATSYKQMLEDIKSEPISNYEITPQQKQKAQQLYSQYLEQNPDGSAEEFKNWVDNRSNFDNEITPAIDVRATNEVNEYGNTWNEISINQSRDLDNILMQRIPQGREVEEYVATEKTIRDLAARMSDRIGVPVKVGHFGKKTFKGSLINGVAHVNLDDATLDTPIHEILGHPIIRAIKLKSEKTIESEIDKMIEMGIIKKEC